MLVYSNENHLYFENII